MTITVALNSTLGPRVAQFEFPTDNTMKAVSYALHELLYSWVAPEDMDRDEDEAAVEYHIVSLAVH